MKAALVDTHADRGDYEKSLEIGPSLRYRPLPQMHIDFAPLIGIGADSRAADLFLVVGWELWPAARPPSPAYSHAASRVLVVRGPLPPGG